MSNKFGTFDYDENIDEEVVDLCNALNSLQGVKTHGSCCGHGKHPFDITFKCTSQESLFFIGRCMDARYWKHGHCWDLKVEITDRSFDESLPVYFVIESKESEDAIEQAKSLIENMEYHLEHKNFMKGFNLTGKILRALPYTPTEEEIEENHKAVAKFVEEEREEMLKR